MNESEFQTRLLPEGIDELAPDGSEIRWLCRTGRMSLVHVTLNPGEVSHAVAHRSVEEVWYFLGGRGELWRSLAGSEAVVAVTVGVTVSLPVGAAFQVRALGDAPLTALCVTVPPWPGATEAGAVAGPWSPRLRPE